MKYDILSKDIISVCQAVSAALPKLPCTEKNNHNSGETIIKILKGGMVITPRIMMKFKKLIPITMAAVMTCISIPAVAYADNSRVVTLGADLTDEQRTSMYEYFGTTSGEVATIEVNNTDERQYMEGIASERAGSGHQNLQLRFRRANSKWRYPGKNSKPYICHQFYDREYASDLRC